MELKIKGPQVSVIIPTHNSARTLPSCLTSLERQTYKPSEVIVVDNHSVDASVEIAKRHGAEVLVRKSNQAEARNIGLAESSGKYVLFLDSDQSLSPSVIEECVEKCENGIAGMVRIPEIFVGEGYWSVCSATWKNNYEKVEFLYRNGVALMHGEPRFFVKSYMQDVGGYDPGLVWGEDYDLLERLRRAGLKEGFCKAVLYHHEASSLRQILLKNLRYGKSMPQFVEKTQQAIFPRMATHAFFTFVEMLKRPEKPEVVAGCGLLLLIKSSLTLFGLISGAGP